MSISFTKQKLKGRDNKPVKYKSVPYPQPKENSGLPKNFFVCLCIGARQSGKTVSTVKLIKYYEKEGVYNQRGERIPIKTILISPTFESNPIFKSLKSLDIENDVYSEYSDKLILKILEDIEKEKAEIEEYQEKLQMYNKFLKVRKLTELTPYETITLSIMDFKPPMKTVEYDNPPVYNLILDDLVGTNTFKPVGASALNNLILKNRHKGINIFILAQSAKQIPKIIRINASLLLLYKYNSDKMLDDLFEAVSGVISLENFKILYEEAVSEKYNFLTVDCTKQHVEFKQNFDHLFVIKDLTKDKDKIEKIKKTV